MGSLNKVMLIGNLGRDPEVRSIASGVKVANFSIATSESYTDKNSGQKVEKTEWHNIVMWRGLAEIAEKYLKKGSQIYVEGRLQTRSWDDQNGQKKYMTEVIVDNLVMLGRAGGGNRDGGSGDGFRAEPAMNARPSRSEFSGPASSSSSSMPPAPQEDDLPF